LTNLSPHRTIKRINARFSHLIQGPPPRNEASSVDTMTRCETTENTPTSALDLRLTDPSHLQELTARLELRGNFAIQPPGGDSETLRKVQQEKSKKIESSIINPYFSVYYIII
jgi:hypothetical protein